METGSDDRITELERQVRDITRRLAALERPAGRFAMTMPALGETAFPETAFPETAPPTALAAERGQGQQRVREQDEEPTVGYSGIGRFGRYRTAIRRRVSLSEMLSTSPESISPVFAGLASPARISLLYALIGGPCTSQQLREVLDASSVGQLYHHLRELLAAGLIVQPARSVYQIPPGKVVAVCVAISAATQLMPAGRQAPPPSALPGEGEPGDDGATEREGDGLIWPPPTGL